MMFHSNKQANKQNTHHFGLGRYRDSGSKTFTRPHHQKARFMGQRPGLCHSPTELCVWHRCREKIHFKTLACATWGAGTSGICEASRRARRPGWGPEATSCFSGKPHTVLLRPSTHGARLALMPQVHLLYLKSADCRCQPHLQNTFTATPGPHDRARKPG